MRSVRKRDPDGIPDEQVNEATLTTAGLGLELGLGCGARLLVEDHLSQVEHEYLHVQRRHGLAHLVSIRVRVRVGLGLGLGLGLG